MRKLVKLTIGVFAALGATTGHAGTTYMIDENLDNTDNGCLNAADLNDVTTPLQTALTGAGWTGSRWVNSNSWPQDFMESCGDPMYGSGGGDNGEADSKTLAVFSGHGNKGVLAYGTIHGGVCAISLGTNIRLGSMGGAQNVTSIYATCCTLAADSLGAQANNEWNRQQLGFHDTSEIGNGDVGNFFNGSATGSNKNAWFNHLEDRPGWFTGDNSPMVWSAGANSTEAASVENTASLRQQIFQTPRGSGPICGAGQPAFWVSATFIDHHNGGC